MSFTTSDYEQLQLLMDESPENKALIQKLLDTHQYTVSKISHEIRNPLSLVYSMLQMTEPSIRKSKTSNTGVRFVMIWNLSINS